MAFYWYKLVSATGIPKRGVMRLPFVGAEAAVHHLERTGQIVVDIKPLPAPVDRLLEHFALQSSARIRKQDVAELLRNIAVMLRAGVVLSEALSDAVDHVEDRRVKRVGEGMMLAVASGVSLHDAMLRYKEVFPDHVLFMIKVAEESGQLASVLDEAAAHLKRVHRLSVDIKKALIYPIIALLGTFGALVFWVYYTIPSLVELYRQMQVELPEFTRLFLEAVQFVRGHASELGIGLIILIAGSMLMVRALRPLQVLLAKLLMRIPVVGNVMRYGSSAFLFEYLAMLVRVGVELPRALRIVAGATSNALFSEAALAVQGDIENGNTISSALKRTELFPNFVIRMVRAGEQSGHLDEQLRMLADDYAARHRDIVEVFKTLVEPFAIVVVGGLLIVMVIALFFPVYSLINQINAGGF